MEDKISRDLWLTSMSTSGARLRFRSDTTMFGLELFSPDPDEHVNLTGIARSGFDLYADGCYWHSIQPKQKGKFTGILFENVSGKMRDYTIYYPLYDFPVIFSALLDDDAGLLPPIPFAVEEPVVFYGTSITQGGCASRPGLSYQAILSRSLNIDFINLGFSGCGKGERCIASSIAQIDAACYVLDYGQNNQTAQELESVYLPFIEEIRHARPAVPILASTPIFSSKELWNDDCRRENDEKRKVIRKAVQVMESLGDRNIHLVEGFDLLPPALGDGLIDDVHPNDIGFAAMSAVFERILRNILHL